MSRDDETDFRSARRLENPQLLGRILLKRCLYAGFYLQQVILILLGRQKPVVPFRVEASPPSLYFNFPILAKHRDELLRHLGVPESFALAPIRTLRGGEPEYYLTLNIYRVSGITNGLRAEWSVYIADRRNTPRYMVVDACTSQYSMDPVDVITKPGEIHHEGDETAIRSRVECGLLGSFACTIDIGSTNVAAAEAHGEWIAANDFIYWRNGVCDRAYYQGGMANADLSLISAAPDAITGSGWNSFVDAAAVQIVRVNHGMDLAVSPWWNL